MSPEFLIRPPFHLTFIRAVVSRETTGFLPFRRVQTRTDGDATLIIIVHYVPLHSAYIMSRDIKLHCKVYDVALR